MNKKSFRKGGVGALMDEYEKAIDELKSILVQVKSEHFTLVLDEKTNDPDCKSIQSITNHVVRAGYGYANYMRLLFSENWVERKLNYDIHSTLDACSEVDKMISYMNETLKNNWDLDLDNLQNNSIKTSWGQLYDFEQLFEHAIVHVLRHRRQIERFLIKLS